MGPITPKTHIPNIKIEIDSTALSNEKPPIITGVMHSSPAGEQVVYSPAYIAIRHRPHTKKKTSSMVWQSTMLRRSLDHSWSIGMSLTCCTGQTSTVTRLVTRDF